MLKDAFNTTMEMLLQSMDVTMKRRKLIASNVANAETPGYKAADLDFDAMLKGEDVIRPVSMSRTHEKHMQPLVQPSYPPVKYKMDMIGEVRGDGNTVEMEEELAHLTENQIRFETITRVLNKSIKKLKTAIEQGGR
jgi:flagellar basal-body rod protein FlgB